MEKIIEKMGLYDIWTVFFPGVVFLDLVKTLYGFMLTLPCSISKKTSIIEQVFIFCKAKSLSLFENVFYLIDLYGFLYFPQWDNFYLLFRKICIILVLGCRKPVGRLYYLSSGSLYLD